MDTGKGSGSMGHNWLVCRLYFFLPQDIPNRFLWRTFSSFLYECLTPEIFLSKFSVWMVLIFANMSIIGFFANFLKKFPDWFQNDIYIIINKVQFKFSWVQIEWKALWETFLHIHLRIQQWRFTQCKILWEHKFSLKCKNSCVLIG